MATCYFCKRSILKDEHRCKVGIHHYHYECLVEKQNREEEEAAARAELEELDKETKQVEYPLGA